MKVNIFGSADRTMRVVDLGSLSAQFLMFRNVLKAAFLIPSISLKYLL